MAQDPPPNLPDLDAMLDIAARFEAARARDPRLRDAVLGDLLRLVPDKRAIFRGELDARSVIYRMILTQGDRSAAKEWDELCRLWPHMSDGDYRTPEPVHFNAEHGLLVMGEITGTPLMKHFTTAAKPARIDAMQRAAEWHRHSTRLSEDWQLIKSQGWINRAARSAQAQPFAHLRDQEARVLDEMRRIGGLIDGHRWRTAISHGDLHPNNLILNGTRLTGLDCGGSGRLPIYKDMARFLMHMGRRRMFPSRSRCLGVDGVGIKCFAQAFDLSPEERGLFLPFLIAFEALIRVETLALPASRIRRAEKMYRDLLPDLRRVGTSDSPV